MAHDAAAESAMMLPAGNMKALGAVGAQLDGAAVQPRHCLLFVMLALHCIGGQILKQPMQSYNQLVRLACVTFQAWIAHRLKVIKV